METDKVCDDDIKAALGRLLLSADQNQIAKTVLGSFNPFASRSNNIKSVSKFKLELLEPCAEFLNIPLKDSESNKLYTKSCLVLRIIIAIEALLPAVCQQCSEKYCIELAQTDLESPDDPPSFICHMCFQGSHNCEPIKQCKEALDSLSLTTGHTWLCNNCHTDSIPVAQRKSRSRVVSISEPPSRIENNSPPPALNIHTHEIDQADLQQRLNSVSRSRLCKKYVSGKCLHGLRGKKEVNGQTCSFDHPKKCFKFCGFGTGRKGCNDGDNCQYFHPTLCKFSVTKRACYNQNCTFVHLKGTNRSRQSGASHDDNRYRSHSESANSTTGSRQRSHSNPRQSNREVNPQNPRGKNTMNQSFLELKELVEQMKTSFVTEISSIKASLASSIHHYPPMVTQHPQFHPMGQQKIQFQSPQVCIPPSSY